VQYPFSAACSPVRRAALHRRSHIARSRGFWCSDHPQSNWVTCIEAQVAAVIEGQFTVGLDVAAEGGDGRFSAAFGQELPRNVIDVRIDDIFCEAEKQLPIDRDGGRGG
jgi:hypothetical protein